MADRVALPAAGMHTPDAASLPGTNASIGAPPSTPVSAAVVAASVPVPVSMHVATLPPHPATITSTPAQRHPFMGPSDAARARGPFLHHAFDERLVGGNGLALF